MDTIFLHGLRIDCVIGVWEWERRITQSVYIDVDLGADIGDAAQSDRLEDTVSYKDIAVRITEIAREGRFHLVESLAEQVARSMMEEFSAPWCLVRVNKKGAVSGAGDVGVIIERGSRG